MWLHEAKTKDGCLEILTRVEVSIREVLKTCGQVILTHKQEVEELVPRIQEASDELETAEITKVANQETISKNIATLKESYKVARRAWSEKEGELREAYMVAERSIAGVSSDLEHIKLEADREIVQTKIELLRALMNLQHFTVSGSAKEIGEMDNLVFGA